MSKELGMLIDQAVESDEPRRGLTRRQLIALGAQGTLAAASGSLLAGCGGGRLTSSSASSSGGRPVRGGTFNLGLITGGTAEQLNPAIALGPPDQVRAQQLFDRLFEFTDGADLSNIVPNLATSVERNADATVWTFRLRDGVTWHDGKPFGADDVLWTIRSWANPNYFANGIMGSIIDFSALRKRDRLTVEVPLAIPIAQFPSLTSLYNNSIVQNGATDKHFVKPVGTGPFKYQSFTPGQQSVFVANREYWQHPKPYVAKLVITSSFTDESARFNALLSGALNIAPLADTTIAKTQQSNPQVTFLRAPSSSAEIICMRVDKGQFADVRVRQAMRLCADRPALVEAAISGFGRVGNDLQGLGTAYFASDLTRSQDIEQAKSLLKSAGREGLTFSLPTSNVWPGFTESATLFAEQAKAAGVNIVVTTLPSAQYFQTSSGYASRQIGQDDGLPYPSLTLIYRQFFSSGCPYGDTHWGSQPGGVAAEKLLSEAIGAVDPAKARELWREVQLQLFKGGGELNWAVTDNIDFIAKNVRLKTGPSGNLNNFRLLDGWIA